MSKITVELTGEYHADIGLMQARIEDLEKDKEKLKEESSTFELSADVAMISARKMVSTASLKISEGKAEINSIKKLLAYPEEWDTAAYPTLETAIIECMQ